MLHNITLYSFVASCLWNSWFWSYLQRTERTCNELLTRSKYKDTEAALQYRAVGTLKRGRIEVRQMGETAAADIKKWGGVHQLCTDCLLLYTPPIRCFYYLWHFKLKYYTMFRNAFYLQEQTVHSLTFLTRNETHSNYVKYFNYFIWCCVIS
jgi:hypothetical protein